MFKKILAIILVITMALSLAACGVKKSINEKITEKVTEGVLEKAIGGNVDIDIDGEEVKIQGEDGEVLSFGKTEWPSSGAAGALPVLDKGNVVSVINSDTGAIIIIEKVNEKDYNNYIEELKDAGFINNVTEYSSQESLAYHASSNENVVVGIIYTPKDEALSISVEKRE